MSYSRACCWWLLFLAVAVTCGMLRDQMLTPLFGAVPGRAAGTLLVSGIIFGLIYLYVRKLPAASRLDLCKLGIFWTALTLAFECLFGRVALGLSWKQLLADYNVFQGRLWPLVLLTTLLGPLWARKMRRPGGLSSGPSLPQ